MKLKVKKIHSEAKLPSYSYSYDAGMDLYAIEKVKVKPGEIVKVKSGISVEIPKGYVGLFWDKSGISIGNGIKVLGGVIDSGYRGELIIGVINLGKADYIFEKGHKVAQMLIQPVEVADIVEVEELSETPRGTGGFGSAGK